jgi:hypothetical protein
VRTLGTRGEDRDHDDARGIGGVVSAVEPGGDGAHAATTNERSDHVHWEEEATAMKLRWLVVALVALALSGCAGANPLIDTPGGRGVAGFWTGLWHGLICPIAFVLSLFKSTISIYEVHNSGGWYNAGFIIGAGAWGIMRGSGGKRLRQYGDAEFRREAERRGLVKSGSEPPDDAGRAT